MKKTAIESDISRKSQSWSLLYRALKLFIIRPGGRFISKAVEHVLWLEEKEGCGTMESVSDIRTVSPTV